MNEKIPFKRAIRAWVRQRERSLSEHPALAELVSYRDRELTGNRLEAMRDHIAECRACSNILLEFSRLKAENRQKP